MPSLTVPSRPMNLSFEVGEGSVLLKWEPPQDFEGTSIIGYRIHRETSYDNLSYLDSVGPLSLTFNDTKVEFGQEYFSHIMAENRIGGSNQSNTVSMVTPEDEKDTGKGPGILIPILLLIIVIFLIPGAGVFLHLRKK